MQKSPIDPFRCTPDVVPLACARIGQVSGRKVLAESETAAGSAAVSVRIQNCLREPSMESLD